MNITTTGISARAARRVLRPTLLLLLTALVLLTTVMPAAAQPPVPGDVAQPPPESEPTTADDLLPPQPEPQAIDDLVAPQPQPHVSVAGSCNPDGFHYELVHPAAPDDAAYLAQWREAPNGAAHDLGVGSQSGFVPSGEGDFQVRGAILVQGVLFHQFGWTDVTVFCPGLKEPEKDEPTVTIDVAPQCDPQPGIAYEIHVASPPQGPLAYEAQWREPGGQVQTVDGQAGAIPTGEGDFEIRGVLHHQGPGFYATDFVEVTVDCHDGPGGGGHGFDDPPLPGTPNFTG